MKKLLSKLLPSISCVGNWY